jgi:hypothetical protein
MIFWISLESDISIAIGALEIKSEHLDSQINLIITDFHSHVELCTDVKII